MSVQSYEKTSFELSKARKSQSKKAEKENLDWQKQEKGSPKGLKKRIWTVKRKKKAVQKD